MARRDDRQHERRGAPGRGRPSARGAREWPPSPRRLPVTLGTVAAVGLVLAVQVAIGGAGGAPAGLRAVVDAPLALVLLAPLLHGSLAHAAWNVAAFLVVSPTVEARIPPGLYALGLLALGWLTAAAPALLPGGTGYAVGLSGVTHALAAAGLPFALRELRGGHPRGARVAAGAHCLVLTLFALRTFAAVPGAPAAGAVAVQAHLAGLAIGAGAGLLASAGALSGDAATR